VYVYPSISVVHVWLTLKLNSFSANPSLDVPGVKDEKSIRAFGADLDVK
jgi:hypothetical protein